jgi:hypothetical protein
VTHVDEVPQLGREEIIAFLDRHYQSVRSQRALVALYGTGAADTVQHERFGSFEIAPVRSELDLREQMARIEDRDARIAFLVPWLPELPLDLAGRFSGNGKIWRIGRDARLYQLFGVTEHEAGVMQSPLVTYLLAGRPSDRLRVGGGRLTTARMWEAWLGRIWSVEVEGGVALDTLLGWAALDGRGAEFALAMQGPGARPGAAEVRAALLGHLAEHLGPAGPVVWRAWERGAGRAVLEHAVLFEVLARATGADDAVAGAGAVWIKQAMRGLAGSDADEAALVAMAEALGYGAGPALRYVERRAGEAEARALVKAADARVDVSELRAALRTSQRLPSSWSQRLATLGQVLREGAQTPTAERVARAAALLRALEGHALFKDQEQTPVVQRAEMAVRLLAWMAGGEDARRAPGVTDHADVENLGRWYVEDGGYVDWARRWARGSAEGDFGAGVQAVVAAADALRCALDRRFARALVAWYRAGRPARQVVPIEDAVTRVAVKFLDEASERRLLVLLLDGMAWAQAVELMDTMAHRSSPWGPLAWHRSARGRVGDGQVYPVILAAVPTSTDVSRAAFFAGKTMAAGPLPGTDRDVERWRDHRGVSKYFTGADHARVLLRSEGHVADGSASREALQLIGDPERRVVALVINAIDASLKGDAQERNRWGVDDIKSLPEILERARAAGRAVLMASDHGHVPADLLQSVTPNGPRGGARWRPWDGPGDTVSEDEVVFGATDARDAWRPKGAAGVVLLADDRHRYGGGASAGEHGGATLAEVVAPCLLIGCEDTPGVHDDAGQAVTTAFVPPWWYYEVPAGMAAAGMAAGAADVTAPGSAPIAAAGSEGTRAEPAPAERQLELPQILPTSASAAPAAPAAGMAEPDMSSAFARCEVLQARAANVVRRKQVVQAVSLLLGRSGLLSIDAFARAMGEPVYRAEGLISRLQEVLNVDGYQVLRLDRTSRHVHLDRSKLEQQFEVSL